MFRTLTCDLSLTINVLDSDLSLTIYVQDCDGRISLHEMRIVLSLFLPSQVNCDWSVVF